jgi:ABC-type sugar transport system permease subunit
MLPAILLISFVYFIPLLASVYISLTDWNGMGWNMNFVGFKNFTNMFHGQNIQNALFNNFKFFIIIVFGQNFAAVIIAVLLNNKSRGSKIYRASLFLPTLVSTIAVGFIWTLIFDPISGPLPMLTKFLKIPYFNKTTWLGDPNIVLLLIALVNIWQWTGWNTVIYFAGLQSIPSDLYESSEIDGASVLKKFWHITIPMLAPAITINTVVTTIGVLKIFDLPFVMTGGGPGHVTETLAIMIYTESFIANKIGYGTALSLVLFVMVLVIASLQTIYLRKREANIAE